jgi:hypothetical protein
MRNRSKFVMLLSTADWRLKMKYRVHHFNIRMTQDQGKLEQFLNSLKGDVVAIIPNIAPVPVTFHAKVDFLLIVEKVAEA